LPATAERPPGERLGGWEHSGDPASAGTVTSVRITYGGDGPWVSVETAHRSGSTLLRTVLEHHMRMCGDRFAAVSWVEDETTLLVDGQPVAGRLLRAGERWWALRCATGDVEISVVARDWRPGVVAVVTLADLEPLLARPRPRPASRIRPVAEPIPDGLNREPHRALVDVVLRAGRERAGWLANGGPAPALPRYYAALWRAAVRRQIGLTDQPEPVAQRSVSSVVSHLSHLQQEAAWFREDERLRERAIAETLIYATGLSDTVASRPAQLAWQRHQAGGQPADRAREQEYWRVAWVAWADRVGSPARD
jgi:hypothetical protein